MSELTIVFAQIEKENKIFRAIYTMIRDYKLNAFLKNGLFSFLLIALFNTVGTEAQSYEQIFVFASEPDERHMTNTAVTTVKSRLSRSGFAVRDEAALLNSIGIKVDSSKRYILERSAALAQIAGNAVLVFVDAKSIDTLSDHEVWMRAELYSTASKSFLASWSVPNNIIIIPNGCDENCATSLLAIEIDRMADTLGSSLVQLLKKPTGASARDGNVIAILDVEIIDLTSSEIIQLIDLMRNEFPGFVEITRAQSSGPRYRMLYHTTADIQKLGTWVDISLEEIGLVVNEDVQRIITEQRIDIRKISPATPKGSTGNTLKYN